MNALSELRKSQKPNSEVCVSEARSVWWVTARPTCSFNLKVCKNFTGWQDRQTADGTMCGLLKET